MQTATSTSTITITATPTNRPGSANGMTPGSADGLTPGLVDGLKPGSADGLTPGSVDSMPPGSVDGLAPESVHSHIKCTEVGDTIATERFCGPAVIDTVINTIGKLPGFKQYMHVFNCAYTYTHSDHALLYYCHCHTLSPVLSSSGHHSDGVACVVLEASEDGLSCCWVPELQAGLSTSLRMVGHTGGVEAAGR